MKETKKIIVKKLNEEVVNEVTLQQLLSMVEKLETGIIPLVNGTMEFNNSTLKVLATKAKSAVDELANQMRSLIMGAQAETEGGEEEIGDEREELDRPVEGDTLGEAVKKEFAKFLFEYSKSLSKKPLKEADETEEEPVKPVDSKKKIDLTSAFETAVEELTPEQFATFKSKVSDVLGASGVADEEFVKIANEVKAAKDVASFNTILNRLYDFADANDILVECKNC